MNEFTIGEPTDVPIRGKYASIWDAAKGLENGKSLPVEFSDEVDARRFANTNVTWVRHGFRLKRRASTVYVARVIRPTQTGVTSR